MTKKSKNTYVSQSDSILASIGNILNSILNFIEIVSTKDISVEDEKTLKKDVKQEINAAIEEISKEIAIKGNDLELPPLYANAFNTIEGLLNALKNSLSQVREEMRPSLAQRVMHPATSYADLHASNLSKKARELPEYKSAKSKLKEEKKEPTWER